MKFLLMVKYSITSFSIKSGFEDEKKWAPPFVFTYLSKGLDGGAYSLSDPALPFSLSSALAAACLFYLYFIFS